MYLFPPVKSSQEQPGISVFRANPRRKALDLVTKGAPYLLLLEGRVYEESFAYLLCAFGFCFGKGTSSRNVFFFLIRQGCSIHPRGG